MTKNIEAVASFDDAVNALRAQIHSRVEGLVAEMSKTHLAEDNNKQIEEQIGVNRKLIELLGSLEKSISGKNLRADAMANLDFAKARAEILARLQGFAQI